jgi:hypothetical protein
MYSYYCMIVNQLASAQYRRNSSVRTTRHIPKKTCFYSKLGSNLNIKENKRKVIYIYDCNKITPYNNYAIYTSYNITNNK